MNVIHQPPAADAGRVPESHPAHGLLPGTAPAEVDGMPTGPAGAAPPPPPQRGSLRRYAVYGAVATVVVMGGWLLLGGEGEKQAPAPAAAAPALPPGQFRLNDNELKALRIEPVRSQSFQPARVAEGRIAYNEDRSTPIFTPYNGRVVRAPARLGDMVAAGDTLFEVETTDLAGAANELLTAVDALNKARTTLEQALREERRQASLFGARAASQRDVEQARAAARGAEADLRTAQATLDAARDKLRVLGRPAEEIKAIEETRRVNAIVPVVAPIPGVVTQRRVGPGQWLATGGSDAQYTISDLSTMWLVAAVREVDAPFIRTGQQVGVTVGALPDRRFNATITTVGAGLDATTRRLLVRAEVQDPDHLLKPEMFATFRIDTGAPIQAPAVPVEALIFRGSEASVWLAMPDRLFVLRRVRLGIRAGNVLQVVEGLQEGDRIVTGGALFIDRAARID